MKKRMKFFVIMTIFSHFLWGCSEQEANSNNTKRISQNSGII